MLTHSLSAWNAKLHLIFCYPYHVNLMEVFFLSFLYYIVSGVVGRGKKANAAGSTDDCGSWLDQGRAISRGIFVCVCVCVCEWFPLCLCEDAMIMLNVQMGLKIMCNVWTVKAVANNKEIFVDYKGNGATIVVKVILGPLLSHQGCLMGSGEEDKIVSPTLPW